MEQTEVALQIIFYFSKLYVKWNRDKLVPLLFRNKSNSS